METAVNTDAAAVSAPSREDGESAASFIRRLKHWNPKLSVKQAAIAANLNVSNVRTMPEFRKKSPQDVPELSLLPEERLVEWQRKKDESRREHARRLKKDNPELSVRVVAFLTEMSQGSIRNIPEFLRPSKEAQDAIAALSSRRNNETASAYVRRLKKHIPDLSVNDAAIASGLTPSFIHGLPEFFTLVEQDAIAATSPRRTEETAQDYVRRLKKSIPQISVYDAAKASGLSPNTVRDMPEFNSAPRKMREAIRAVSPRRDDETTRAYIRRLQEQIPDLSVKAASLATGLSTSYLRRLPEFMVLSPGTQDVIARFAPRESDESAHTYVRRLKRQIPELSIKDAAVLSGLSLAALRFMPEFVIPYRAPANFGCEADRPDAVDTLPNKSKRKRTDEPAPDNTCVATANLLSPLHPENSGEIAEASATSAPSMIPDPKLSDDAVTGPQIDSLAMKISDNSLQLSPLPATNPYMPSVYRPPFSGREIAGTAYIGLSGNTSGATPAEALEDNGMDHADATYRYKLRLKHCLDQWQQELRDGQDIAAPAPETGLALAECFENLFFQGLKVRLADLHNGLWNMRPTEIRKSVKNNITDFVRSELADSIAARAEFSALFEESPQQMESPLLSRLSDYACQLERLSEVPDGVLREEKDMSGDKICQQITENAFPWQELKEARDQSMQQTPADSFKESLPSEANPMIFPSPLRAGNDRLLQNVPPVYDAPPPMRSMLEQHIEIQLQNGTISATVKWPLIDRDACAAWLRELLR